MRAAALAFGLAACTAEVGVRARAPGAPVVRHGRAGDGPRFEAAPEWRRLGERWIDGRVDHDVISVGRGERFGALQINVEHGALEIFDVVVVFEDGSTYSPPRRFTFAEGGATRVFDFPLGPRAIDRVEFRYAALARSGRAQVELFGKT